MIGRRKTNLDLGMARLYVYQGKRKNTFYTITPKNERINLGHDIKAAKKRLLELSEEQVKPGSIADLLDDLIAEREKLVQLKKLSSETLATNKLESDQLKKVFGKMEPGEVQPKHIWFYLHKARGAESPVRANREIALFSTLFNRALGQGLIDRNPCQGVERNKEDSRDREVSDKEFYAFCRFARRRGDAAKRTALAAMIAYLTGKAQGQVLKLLRAHMSDEGISFGKRKRGAATTVKWSRRLRAYVNASIAMPSDISTMYVVHNQQGAPYTSSGFKSNWQRLMNAWVAEGNERFTFHDLRAKSVGDVIDQGRKASELTGHRTEAIVSKVYDRRRTRKADAVR